MYYIQVLLLILYSSGGRGTEFHRAEEWKGRDLNLDGLSPISFSVWLCGVVGGWRVGTSLHKAQSRAEVSNSEFVGCF